MTRRHPDTGQQWWVVLGLFSVTSLIETMGVSQITAFLPLDLQVMGVSAAAIPRFVGLLNALVFVFGLPLVPLWGVLADKYSRKLIITRSAIVEAIVFAAIAASRHPAQLAVSLLLVGFQLGNTGVMLAAIRDVTPQARLGTAMAVFGASSSVGFAAGPAMGGLLLDRAHTPLAAVFAVSSALSIASAIMLGAWLREVRPRVVPTGAVLSLARSALGGLFTDRSTRHLFGLFGCMMLARQMSSPFLPLLVEQVHGNSAALASAIALVVGAPALVGGIVSPVAGAIGDRVGFRPVLVAALTGAAAMLVAMPAMSTVTWLAVANGLAATCYAAVGAMIYGLLALTVPPDRRSATLNLIYLPLYLAGIAGPAAGALLGVLGLGAIYDAAALVVALAVALEFGAAARHYRRRAA